MLVPRLLARLYVAAGLISAGRARVSRRYRRCDLSPEPELCEGLACQVPVLPGGGVLQPVPGVGVLLMLRDVAVPAIGLENGDDVHGIRRRDRGRRRTLEDDKVVVVLAAGT